MKYTSAGVSFLFASLGVFFLAGLFLMPHLPAGPERPVTPFEGAYWMDNWIGLLLGIPLGLLSAQSVVKTAKEKEKTESRSNVVSTR